MRTREIEDKVHLSPAEAEIGAELGNISINININININIKIHIHIIVYFQFIY